MRLLTSTLLSAALVPAAVALPTVTPPGPSFHAVAPRVSGFAVPDHEVDAGALATVAAEGRGTAAARRLPSFRVGGVSGSGGVAVLTPRRAVHRFLAAGVTWDAGSTPAGAVVSLRVRENGTWGPWQEAPLEDGGPDAGTAEAAASAGRVGTSPLISGGADGVQVRIDSADGTAPTGVRVDTIDPGTSASDNHRPAQPAASAAAATPDVITRKEWGADESLRHGSTSVNRTVKALVLHHTAGSNHYTEKGAYAEIRAVYAYHTKVMKWNDIGYNIVLDRYGRIFEGRKGSVTQAIQGAHAGGFNTDTFGISVMGNFESAKPPAAAVSAIRKVMAWKAAQYGINPKATTRLTSAGGGTSKYKAGTTVSKPTIMGHRDVGSTACPGKYLYPYLGDFRSSLAGDLKPKLEDPGVSASSAGYGTGSIKVTAGVSLPQDWKLTATSICSTKATWSASGSAKENIVKTWELEDAKGKRVPPGIYRLKLTSSSPFGSPPSWSKDVEVLGTYASPSSPCPADRVGGSDLYGTAVQVARTYAASAKAVVIANSADLTDSMAAATLARAKKAAFLPATRTALPAAISAEITRRGTTQAWVVGDSATVSSTVLHELSDLGVDTVTRVSGSNAAGTAAAAARLAGSSSHRAILVPEDEEDVKTAVAAAAVTAGNDRSLLLVKRSGVPKETISALKALHVTSAHMVASQTVFPVSQSRKLPSYGVTTRFRVSDSTRSGTSVALVKSFAKRLDPDHVTIAPDTSATIAAATVAATIGRLVVLTKNTSVSGPTADWLRSSPPEGLVVVGGTSELTTGTLADITEAVSE